MAQKRILFAGYAPVHFVCFESVYRLLRKDPRLEIWLSGGFKTAHDGAVAFSFDGFYDRFEVDRTRVIPFEQAGRQEFDVLICAHLSDSLFPQAVGRTVQIFHGVSFKNRSVREKALRYDLLCLPGRYHAEMYQHWRLVRPGSSRCLIAGFPKADALVQGGFDREAFLTRARLDPARPTLLYAPTGDGNNSLEIMGEKVIEALRDAGRWNLLVKLHDHPKQTNVDWPAVLSRWENDRIRLIHDWNVVPCLRAADLLISDASSVAVEYTLLDRPIVLLDVPKLLEKMVRKHAAVDLETYGQKIGTLVGHAGEIVDAVAEGLAEPNRQSAIRRAMARHVFHRPGSASARVAAIVLHAAGLLSSLPEDVEELLPQPLVMGAESPNELP
ncbi:MAG: CDP-glycerol glycerophosphotransferase family protein [Planctomycetes bacterium]|nr:CDP-glycerol glycerophosphotransferase family protein [Planctomycetota bacterium]